MAVPRNGESGHLGHNQLWRGVGQCRPLSGGSADAAIGFVAAGGQAHPPLHQDALHWASHGAAWRRLLLMIQFAFANWVGAVSLAHRKSTEVGFA